MINEDRREHLEEFNPEGSLENRSRAKPVGEENPDDPPLPPKASKLPSGQGYPGQSSETQSPEEVATDTSGEEVFAHHDTSPDQHVFSHVSLDPPSPTDVTQRVCVRTGTSAVDLLKEFKQNAQYLGSSFSVLQFLDYLRVDQLCTPPLRTHVPMYIVKRSRLENLFKSVVHSSSVSHFAVIVCSFLKPDWVGEDEITKVQNQFEKSNRDGLNALKRSTQIMDTINLNSLAQTLGVTGKFPSDPLFDELGDIMTELYQCLRESASKHLTKQRLVHSLLISGAEVEILDCLLFQDKTKPSPLRVKSVLESLSDHLRLYPVTDTLKNALLDQNSDLDDLQGATPDPTGAGKVVSEAMYWMSLWLTSGVESSCPITWDEVDQLLVHAGVDGNRVKQVIQVHRRKFELDTLSTSTPASSAPAAKPTNLSTLEEHHPHHQNRQLSKGSDDHFGVEPSDSQQNVASIGTGLKPRPTSEDDKKSDVRTAPTSSSWVVNLLYDEREETALLSEKLDSSNPISVLVHAKAVYMASDHRRTRDILDVLNRHLDINPMVLRGKIFGLAITYYREKNYAASMEYFNELEKVSLEHNSPADVSIASIYRGEIYWTWQNYERAYKMFQQARTTYGQDHVAHLYGIIIVTKSAVTIKAGSCQKNLGDFRKAEELYTEAIRIAIKTKENAERSPPSDPQRQRTITSSVKDEIASRSYLGNLLHGVGNYSRALDQYKLVLKLQETVTGEESGSVLGLANSNVGVALMALGHVLESIPYLKKSYELAKRHEKSGIKIGQAANSLGNALLANKQHEEAENCFEMALGHSVYYKDEVGQSKYLGSIGNVRLLQGKLPEALRCYTEALSLNSDESCRITALQNRALVYIKLGTKLTGEEWDEIPEDIEASQPKDIQSAEIPIEETSVHSPGESKRVHLVVPKGSYTPIPLDDASELLRKEDSPPTVFPIPSLQVVRSNSIQQPPSEDTPAQSDILSMSHKKYYFLKAKEDLEQAIALVEKQFAGLQVEGSITFSLSLFETNAKAYYSLQKVHVLLGDTQSALRVAEQNRARNLGEILWSKKRHNPGIASLSHPLHLPDIFKVVNREQVPLILFSYVKQSSTMLAHIMFPNEGETEEQSFHLVRGTKADEGVSLPGRISPINYHFVKLDLSEEFFLNKPYGSTSRSKSEPVSFDQYVMKTLMEYINQRETELFTPIDFQDDETPLTVLFERIARPLVEVIEKRAPKSRELVIVADQAAHFLPWALLQDEWSKVFLGDKYRVRTYPSILTMGVTNHLEEETIVLPSEENFLVVGNPSTPKFSHNGVEVMLGRLPHSEMEAIQIADILETKPIIRELATKSTVKYRLQSAKIIHIATHSSASHGYLAFACNVPVVNTAKPVNAEEALIFIDEIQKMSIHASLVVLSACDSARGQLVNEGVNSVARAFLAAGALSVLVSYVRVPDKSASVFMSLFYRFLSRDGFTTSEAIQKSSMGVRCIKNLSQHVHWGGYQLIGRNIRVQYNSNCSTAKVVRFLGFSTPFPRLSLVQEVETAIFRQDRTPPRDVVLVKGMSVYDPAEVVRDFIVKRHDLFPGGIFWYNCLTLDHLRTSVALVEKILPRLTSIQRTPPERPKKTNKEKSNVSQREAFVNHHKLIILDTPFDLKACVDAIPPLLEQEVDIIVIGNMDYNVDGKVTQFIDANLIRGCVTIEVPHIDVYTSIQRMAYSWLCTHDASPFEEDYDAFDTIANMCLGCATLVRVFEGMLRVEEDDIVQKLANDIELCKGLVTEYKEVNVPPLPSAAGSSSSHLQLPKEIGKKLQSLVKRPGDEKKKQKLMQNGLIDSDQAKRLTDEECVLLSEGLEKLPRFSNAWNNFLLHQLTNESHFLLQCLSYISLYPDIESEGPFLFPESFVLQMAKLLSDAEERQSSVDILSKLRNYNLVLPYPQAVVYPPECHQGLTLLQVPSVIARSVTYDIDQADIAFVLSVAMATLKDQSNLGPIEAIQFRVSLLIEHNDLCDVLRAQDAYIHADFTAS